jgi:SAM-dependent methyltransferase
MTSNSSPSRMSTKRQKCQDLFAKYYTGRKFSRSLYLDLIREHVSSGQCVLDAGCGHYLEISRELPPGLQITGVDLEEHLDTKNTDSPYAVRADLEHLPFPANHFDLVISRSVVEHLDRPVAVFTEFQRVLKPGGKVILSTPNKYDYVSVIATITPNRWHGRLVSRLLQVSPDDVFPTLYRANTTRALNRALTAAGLTKKRLENIGHYPVYLMFSPLLFRLGVYYERLTSLRPFAFLRGTILCLFEKPQTVADSNQPLRRKEQTVGAGSFLPRT